MLSYKELDSVISNARLTQNNIEKLDRESAYELLNGKIEKINFAKEQAIIVAEEKKEIERYQKTVSRSYLIRGIS